MKSGKREEMWEKWRKKKEKKNKERIKDEEVKWKEISWKKNKATRKKKEEIGIKGKKKKEKKFLKYLKKINFFYLPLLTMLEKWSTHSIASRSTWLLMLYFILTRVILDKK